MPVGVVTLRLHTLAPGHQYVRESLKGGVTPPFVLLRWHSGQPPPAQIRLLLLRGGNPPHPASDLVLLRAGTIN